MFSQEDVFMLRRVAEILDKEERLLSEKDNQKSIYKNLVVNADQELSQLVSYMEDHPTVVSPYWHEELIAAIQNNLLRKNCLYEAEVQKEDHGEYSLSIFLANTSAEDGLEFDNYIDTDTVKEDLHQLMMNDFSIRLITNLEEI
jgi:hypothetical protein